MNIRNQSCIRGNLLKLEGGMTEFNSFLIKIGDNLTQGCVSKIIVMESKAVLHI